MIFREIDKIVRNNGWYEVDVRGSHHHYKHPDKPGKITIPDHGGKDLNRKTLKNIFRDAGL